MAKKKKTTETAAETAVETMARWGYTPAPRQPEPEPEPERASTLDFLEEIVEAATLAAPPLPAAAPTPQPEPVNNVLARRTGAKFVYTVGYPFNGWCLVGEEKYPSKLRDFKAPDFKGKVETFPELKVDEPGDWVRSSTEYPDILQYILDDFGDEPLVVIAHKDSLYAVPVSAFRRDGYHRQVYFNRAQAIDTGLDLEEIFEEFAADARALRASHDHQLRTAGLSPKSGTGRSRAQDKDYERDSGW